MGHSRIDDLEVNEEFWIKNKREILNRLDENNRLLRRYRTNVLAEKRQVEGEVEELEQDNYSLLGRLKELEIRHLEKDNATQKLYTQLHALKMKLIRPLAEESGCWSAIKFLDSEKSKFFKRYEEAADTLYNNMAGLGSTIMEIDFVKGEVGTLMNKIEMIEDEIPEMFNEQNGLDEKIKCASKALNNLYDRMKKMEKNVKAFYYKKE